ncbi:hypothetical protein, partial [Sphaerisporangium rufum]|uniref:hypothetical protein n=1 Tax=Sphaerisporangium rufum TaxID=1381558 RepID=UPI00195043E6
MKYALKRLATGVLTAATILAGLAVATAGSAPAAQADSTVGGTITRDEVMSRAQNWVDRGIQYNLTRRSNTLVTDPDGGHKYGPDCSGYVSMVWHLSPGSIGGLNTSGFASWSGKKNIGLSELKPGDALLTSGHIELFARWKNDADHTQGAYVYSLNGGSDPDGDGWENDWAKGPGTNSHGQVGFDSWSELTGYQAIRYNNIVDAPATGP